MVNRHTELCPLLFVLTAPRRILPMSVLRVLVRELHVETMAGQPQSRTYTLHRVGQTFVCLLSESSPLIFSVTLQAMFIMGIVFFLVATMHLGEHP